MSGKAVRAALYARVSTTQQDHALQLDELREVATQRDWRLVGEFVDLGESGGSERRPELDRLMVEVHRGRIDVVAVWKFDRFARSVRHLVTALDEFRARGVEFVSVRDAIDTTTPAGRFQFQIIAAVAEFEREIIRERVRAGLAAAQRRGKRIGRPPRVVDVDRARALLASGIGVRETARRVGASPRTLRRHLSCGAKPPPNSRLEVGADTSNCGGPHEGGET